MTLGALIARAQTLAAEAGDAGPRVGTRRHVGDRRGS